ncbi:MAG: hypothetical protein GF388_02140 [Candidatus Aegiribacteria sp.]|nr:hypothetical protein [Candidatus Aegiribacteria sp.]
MNKRAYHIRLEIDKLKRELADIEGDNLSQDEKTDSATAMTCGHDVIIDNLRSTARRLGKNGRAVLAGWQESRGGSDPWWYSTTCTPDILPYDIRNVDNLVEVLQLFSDRNALELVKLLYEDDTGLNETELSNKLGVTAEELGKIISVLFQQEYISKTGKSFKLTFKGWQFFIVVSHLIWFQNLKLKPSVALKIAPVFQEVFGIHWGEYLSIDEEDALDKLAEQGWLDKLSSEGIEREDVCKAIYEHNSPR